LILDKMRFKRLKLLVAITIVAFILVIANILVFSNFQNNLIAVPNKNQTD